MLSFSRVRPARCCGRGRTNRSAAMKTRYDAELMKNAHGMPKAAIAAAASAGPLARAMLNVIELSAIAEPRSRRDTSDETIARCAGAEKAAAAPRRHAETIPLRRAR